jgi:cell division protein FtsQ
MRRVKPAKSLRSARFLLFKRRVQKYLPRHPGRWLLGLSLAAGVGVGGLAVADLFDHGSRLSNAALAASAAFGLSVQDVEVEGRVMTSADDVLRSLGVAQGMPILGASPEKARLRLESLPWVRSATVERHLPDTIFVRLTEHLDRYANLLLVVGEDAPKHTQELIDILKTQPDLMKRVSSAVRVGERRWNLQLDNNIAIELPEENVADAWAHLAEIEKAHALLARDIQSVDLRLSDRVVVKTAPEPQKSPAKPAKAAAKT